MQTVEKLELMVIWKVKRASKTFLIYTLPRARSLAVDVALDPGFQSGECHLANQSKGDYGERRWKYNNEAQNPLLNGMLIGSIFICWRLKRYGLSNYLMFGCGGCCARLAGLDATGPTRDHHAILRQHEYIEVILGNLNI